MEPFAHDDFSDGGRTVAEEGGWGERLTRRVFVRWREVQAELQDIEAGPFLLSLSLSHCPGLIVGLGSGVVMYLRIKG